MNPQIIVPYEEARPKIEDGDVLLFRAGKFPSIGWLITITGGIHSHVGLAFWSRDRLYCVEQREFKGGRSVVLSSQVSKFPCTIDVYRPNPSTYKLLRSEANEFYWEERELTKQTKNNIIDTALGLTGTSYGWANIWSIFKTYAFGFRLFARNKNGDDTISKAYVCSTLVSYSYRIHYQDPCPNLKDDRTKPSDIAQSSLFHYMFTIA